MRERVSFVGFVVFALILAFGLLATKVVCASSGTTRGQSYSFLPAREIWDITNCEFAFRETDTLTKTAPSQIQAGDVLTYGIVVSNSSHLLLSTFVVTDFVPLHTSYVGDSMSSQPENLAIETPPLSAEAGAVMTWTIPSLGMAGSATDTVTLTFGVDIVIPITDGTIITNTARMAEATATTQTVAKSAPAVTVTKSVWPETVIAGRPVTYTIYLTNTGKGIAVGTQVVDHLPAGAQYDENLSQGTTPEIQLPLVTWSNIDVVDFYSLTFVSTTPMWADKYHNFVTVTCDTQSWETGPAALIAVEQHVHLPNICRDYLGCDRDPYEPNNSPGEAYRLASNTTLQANFCEIAIRDEYVFAGIVGRPIQISLTNIPEGCNYDLYLHRVADPARSVARSTNSGNADEHVSYTPSQNEDFIIMVYAATSCSQGRTSDYTLQCNFQ